MDSVKCDECRIKKCDTRKAINKFPILRKIIKKNLEDCHEFKKKIIIIEDSY